MNLGFYYHIPLQSSSEGLKISSYLGVFLDTLANEVDVLTLFMHEANKNEVAQCDYILKASNIKYRSLSYKTPAWYRFIWPGITLNKIKSIVSECDIILVRAPSPLAPAFFYKFHKVSKVAYLVVGDYVDGARNLDQPWWRKIPITVLSFINDKQLLNVLKKSKALVNSERLFKKYDSSVSDLNQVRTTTLLKTDFFVREDTCHGGDIKLLYTGSYSFAKGLSELMDAFSIINQEYKSTSLHFVGWDYDLTKPVENQLKKQSFELGIPNEVYFHGFKSVGSELNTMYRMADIYIIPSYHEGFPRTIWEAMANSLPVIATRVGSIPHFLKDHESALLIEPRNKQEIVSAIREIIENEGLRRKLISKGYELAKENTLEIQTRRLVNILKS